MILKSLLSILVAITFAANAQANFTPKANPNAADISDTIKGLIGEKDKAHDQTKEEAIAWFVQNYKSVFTQEITLETLNKCHETAMNKSELIGCASSEARRNFARTYDTFTRSKEMVSNMADSAKKEALLGQLEKSKNAYVVMLANFNPIKCLVELMPTLFFLGA